MTTGTLKIDGTEVTLTEDGWTSPDAEIAASLNRGWPVGVGYAVGDPVGRAFAACVKDTGAEVVAWPVPDELPPGVIS